MDGRNNEEGSGTYAKGVPVNFVAAVVDYQGAACRAGPVRSRIMKQLTDLPGDLE